MEEGVLGLPYIEGEVLVIPVRLRDNLQGLFIGFLHLTGSSEA